MHSITISDISIRTDDAGRFCLNDLHRASGGNPNHRPGEWLRNKQSQALITEMATAGISAVQASEGANGGTYVAKELVYAYAMWISPAFHLKVIRAYDQLVSAPAQNIAIPQTLPDALRLAADLAEQKAKAEAALAIAVPKAEALDRIAGTDGSFCLTDAAKALQVAPRRFMTKLQEMGWIYRRPMGSGWLAYQDRIQVGLMEHKVTTGDKSDGTEWTSTQVRVTAKGMARLSIMFAVSLEAA